MILNITQHAATPDQLKAGVMDLPPEQAARVAALLTFEAPPESWTMLRRAEDLARIVGEVGEIRAYQEPGSVSGVPYLVRPRSVMIGGAAFFMSTLETVLLEKGFFPLYAFSRRESREETLADGNVRKVAFFRHLGFVPACPPEPLEPGQN